MTAWSTPPFAGSETTAKGAAHAVETLVGTGVRITSRMRPNPELPVDGPLPGGKVDP